MAIIRIPRAAVASGGDSGPDLNAILSRLAPLGSLAKGVGKLSGSGTLGDAGTGVAGLLSLARGIAAGDPGQAIGGAANFGSGLAGLAGYPGVSSALGAVGGPLMFATGLARGDPLSATLGGLQTGSMVSGWLGGPTLSSLGSSLYGLLPGASTGAAAGAGAAGSAAAGAGSWGGLATLAPVAMMVMGGMAGKGRDAEMSDRAIRESQAVFGNEMGRMRAVQGLDDASFTGDALPDTLKTLYDAQRYAPDLGLYHVGTENMPIEQGAQMDAAVTGMRAKAGQQWLRALEAAQAQGLDLTPQPFDERNRQNQAPAWAPTDVLESPWRVGRNGEAVAIDMQRPLSGPRDSDTDQARIAHLLDLTGGEAQALANELRGGQYSWGQILEMAATPDTGGENEGPAWDLFRKAYSPERLAILKERTGFDPNSPGANGIAPGDLDPGKVNPLLDRAWTSGITHDALRDTGLAGGLTRDQLTEAGIDATPGGGNWQPFTNSTVFGGGANVAAELPTIAEFDAFDARLADGGVAGLPGLAPRRPPAWGLPALPDLTNVGGL